ncbi:PREDICTED: oxysterol-binding protein 2-like, partial [Myotis brandtii]|uniref:oxysterol-binding protein 2-like n=1 Tax=Myotis brandtii TaxID=109478 RepID=UPI00070455BC
CRGRERRFVQKATVLEASDQGLEERRPIRSPPPRPRPREPSPRSQPEPQKTPPPRPGYKPESDLQPGPGRESGPRQELGPRVGEGHPPKASSGRPPAPVVGSVPSTRPESGSQPASKPPALPRPGQLRVSYGVPIAGAGTASTAPKALLPLLPLDSFKGWLLKWTNYLKGYQRRWFVLSNGLLSYYSILVPLGQSAVLIHITQNMVFLESGN